MSKKILSLLLAVIMVCSLFVSPALAADANDGIMLISDDSAPSFRDWDEDHWAAEAMTRWVNYDIIHGDDKGNINADSQITRAEMAQIMLNLLGLSKTEDVSRYNDIQGGEWYEKAILACTAANIMEGHAHYANPNRLITRQEAIVMFARAMGVKKSTDTSALAMFDDGEEVAAWAAGYIAPMAAMGTVTGSGNGTVAPTAIIDRASIFALLDKSISAYITEPGTYNVDSAAGFVVVAAEGTGKVTVTGTAAGVVVAAATEKAEVTLSGVTAEVVKLDGDADVTITGKSNVGSLEVNGASSVEIAKGSTVTDTKVENAGATVEDKNTGSSGGNGGGGGVYIPTTPPEEPTPSPAPTTKASPLELVTIEETPYGEAFGTWAGLPTYDKTKVTYTKAANGTTYTASGTLPYVEGFTGFHGTDPEQQEGWYATFMFKGPAGFTGDMTATLTTVGGHKENSDTPATDKVLKFTATQLGGDYVVIMVHLTEDKGSSTYKIDWDSEGTLYEETTYTIDWSGLTLKPKGASGDKASPLELVTIQETPYNDVFSTWAGHPTYDKTLVTYTKAANGTTYTASGTLPYVKDFTGFHGTDEEQQKGWYATFMFTGPADFTGDMTATLTTVGGHKENSDTPATDKVLKFTATQLGGDYVVIMVHLTKNEGTSTYKIDWDSEGTLYEETTYTIDWSGLTLEAEKVTVTFKDGDTVVSETEYAKGAEIAAPETIPTAEGKGFMGWYNGDEKFVAGTTATANVTYTAKWTESIPATQGVNGVISGVAGKLGITAETTTENGSTVLTLTIPADVKAKFDALTEAEKGQLNHENRLFIRVNSDVPAGADGSWFFQGSTDNGVNWRAKLAVTKEALNSKGIDVTLNQDGSIATIGQWFGFATVDKESGDNFALITPAGDWTVIYRWTNAQGEMSYTTFQVKFVHAEAAVTP